MKWFLLKTFLLLFLLSVSSPAPAYERIVSLKPNLTEILFALGLGDKIVGVTTFCDYPPEAQKIDKVSDYLQPDLEKLMAKRPDLVLTSKENSSRREIDFLIHRGYTVMTYESETLAELKETLLSLGEKLGKGEVAKKIVDQMNAQLEELKKKSAGSSFPKALFVVGHQPLVIAGSNNLFDDIAPYLGLQNVAGGNHFRYPTYSLEMVLAQAPDIILDFSMGSEATEAGRQEMLQWWSRFSGLPAVKNKKVYFYDMGKIRASPRLPLELAKLYDWIHRTP